MYFRILKLIICIPLLFHSWLECCRFGFYSSLILCDDDLFYLHYNRNAHLSIDVKVLSHLKELTSHPRITHTHWCTCFWWVTASLTAHSAQIYNVCVCAQPDFRQRRGRMTSEPLMQSHALPFKICPWLIHHSHSGHSSEVETSRPQQVRRKYLLFHHIKSGNGFCFMHWFFDPTKFCFLFLSSKVKSLDLTFTLTVFRK